MICVTRIKGQRVALNPDLVETVEEMPDTTIRLVSGEKILVRETMNEMIELTVQYRRRIHQPNRAIEPGAEVAKAAPSGSSPPRGPMPSGGPD